MAQRIYISVGQTSDPRLPGFQINSSQMATEGRGAIFNQDWRDALPKLAAQIAPGDAIEADVEVNCHGANGRLLLLPEVNLQNVDLFGGLIRKIARPGGRIDVFACSVAGVSYEYIRARTSKTVYSLNRRDLNAPEAETDSSWRDFGLFSEQSAHEGRSDYMARTGPLTLQPMTYIYIMRELINNSASEVTCSYNARNLQVKSFDVDRKTGQVAMGEVISDVTSKAVARTTNGPLFCARLARAAQLTVRASVLIQTEEGDNIETRAAYRNPFGQWEGLVFDFLPNGNVRFVGDNPSRFLDRDVDHSGFKGFQRLA